MSDLISRQAAIDLVMDVCNAVMSGCESRYDPEVGDEVYDDILEVNAILTCNKEVRKALKGMPSAQPEIIRCKDCKYYTPVTAQCEIRGKGLYLIRGMEDFCSRAERRADE